MTSKIIYDPEGNAVEHSFHNAYDLLIHAGWTALPINKAAIVEADEEPVVCPLPEPVAPVDETPDFAAMTKPQLEDYAAENYNVELDKRKSQPTLAAEVAKLYEEHTAE